MRESIISYLNLTRFYGRFFSVKSLTKGALDLITGNRLSYPLSVNFLITDRCNFFCKMCTYGGNGYKNGGISEEELKLGDFERFISEIKDYRPLLHIGGGEPFLRADLVDIVNVIKRAKLRCIISTNGYLMNSAIIDRLLRLGVDAVIFSLYGWGGIHDEITGVAGAFEKTFGNLKSFLGKRRNGTRIIVSTLPLPENIKDMRKLISNLHSLGIDAVKIENLNFITSTEQRSLLNYEGDFDFSPSVFVKDDYFGEGFIGSLLDVYREIRRNYKKFVLIKPYLTEKQLRHWYGAGLSGRLGCFFTGLSVFINYNGDIIPCQFLTNCKLGNIRSDSLKRVWKSDIYKTLRKSITSVKPAVCRRCCKN